ncbi:TetR/AcrR family transcriptional regulator [Kibdelosporangium aridum]|uniref:Transcriptional regulator, TetR family n=1 Tax=Kibdelosporangium aridum TaxID=2030 RepID=A0A1Y5XWD3_KIBAR|nr:TetR/AcrR family transcriptional regulator C-terminal domain-containing protein [Kibdelosporangium aridum]SMD20314.1 transcriptional regulator, TetR family [Kibdelosporangium aridum]
MPKRTLTREKILSAALELIDEAGLEALSMRRLGQHLGVDPMAVYHHIPNKDELLRGVVVDVFSRMPVPVCTGTWQEQVLDWARAYRDLALAHPNLVLRIVTDARAVSVAAARINEPLYAALEAGGLSPREVVGAVGLIVDYVNGYALAVSSAKDASDTFMAELASLPAEQSAVQLRTLRDPEASKLDHFEYALSVMVAGLTTAP